MDKWLPVRAPRTDRLGQDGLTDVPHRRGQASTGIGDHDINIIRKILWHFKEDFVAF